MTPLADDSHGTVSNKGLVGGSRQVARAPWIRPELTMLQGASAQTGSNSTTDANATFS